MTAPLPLPDDGPKIGLPFVPEPVLSDFERQELRAALATPASWAAHLAAIPCPDCEDGCCEEHV